MPFFGLGSKNKNKKKEEHAIREKPEIVYYAKYMGGLKKFPKEEHSMVLIFPDRIEVNPFGLKLPYSSIIDIEKLSESSGDYPLLLHLLKDKRFIEIARAIKEEFDTGYKQFLYYH
jgi:hypothetical protein